MYKNLTIILISSLFTLNVFQIKGQCIVTDSKECEKTIYKIDVNNKCQEIVFDSCGTVTSNVKLEYNAQNQCTSVETSAEGGAKSSLGYNNNKKLSKAIIEANGNQVVNSYSYIGNSLDKIVSSMDAMGVKFQATTKFVYVNGVLNKIDFEENMSKKKESIVQAITYSNQVTDKIFDKNSQANEAVALGFYAGMGGSENLIEIVSKKLVKSYLLKNNDTCDKLIKVEFNYISEVNNKLKVVKKKTCNGKTTSETHILDVDCK
jgi:hypothetical protein